MYPINPNTTVFCCNLPSQSVAINNINKNSQPATTVRERQTALHLFPVCECVNVCVCSSVKSSLYICKLLVYRSELCAVYKCAAS